MYDINKNGFLYDTTTGSNFRNNIHLENLFSYFINKRTAVFLRRIILSMKQILNLLTDFFLFRFAGALIHLLKTSLGTGILAVPFAFRSVGFGTGLIGTVLIGALCTHTVTLLVSNIQPTSS